MEIDIRWNPIKYGVQINKLFFLYCKYIKWQNAMAKMMLSFRIDKYWYKDIQYRTIKRENCKCKKMKEQLALWDRQ